MKIARSLPPAVSQLYPKDVITGLHGIINGKKEIDRFDYELKDYYRIKHCFLVSNGKTALTLILRAIHKIHPHQNKVIIPAYVCYSVPSAVIRAGPGYVS